METYQIIIALTLLIIPLAIILGVGMFNSSKIRKELSGEK